MTEIEANGTGASGASGDDKPIIPVPPPWKLKGDIYVVSYWNQKGNLPEYAYSPLEGSTPDYSTHENPKHVGGLSQVQVIRYTESPVGPYDELIICPGSFECQMPNGKGGSMKKRTRLRITRIYVSQKYTCWNGRKNWNIPKHLARFEFEDLPGGGMTVKVYPHDTAGGATYDPLEKQPATTPFFQTTIRPMRWLPAFPLSLSWLGPFKDIHLVQPPCPEGKSLNGELAGTDRWCAIMPIEKTWRAMLAWADMSQKGDDSSKNAVGDEGEGEGEGEDSREKVEDNFWPGIGRWQLAVKLENADIEFGNGQYWDLPRASL
jgi:hypothetical protein